MPTQIQTSSFQSSSIPEYPIAAVSLAETSQPTSQASLRSRVLDIVRAKMPIETLFKIKLKLDLSLFVKDQELILQLSEELRSLATKATNENHPIDIEYVKNHVESSPSLLELLNQTLSNRAESALPLLYQACVDALIMPAIVEDLEPAIEHRIYTLKNALISQISPELLAKTTKKASQDELETITKQGRIFLNKTLKTYLTALEGTHTAPSFKEQLVLTANQLTVFVKDVTRMYLEEGKKAIPSDVNMFSFRNPSGHNYHGYVSATVMEGCLSALGYTTQLLNRSDLEPKVTLAPVHSVILVSDGNGTNYVVDPCYIQFHKDICLNDEDLPKEPVLVIEESLVEAYVEEHIMSHWDANFPKRHEKMNLLKHYDQELAYFAPGFLPPDIISLPAREWVKEAFMRLWGTTGYTPLRCDLGFHQIFHKDEKCHKTHDCIKHMQLAKLINRLSIQEIKEKLNALNRSDALRGRNFPEALDLISSLLRADRSRYGALLDTDPRLTENGLDVNLNAYFRSLRKEVNPHHADLKAIYGCGGADVTTILLSTDAQEITFVDLTEVSLKSFQEAQELIKNSHNFLVNETIKNRIKGQDYLNTKVNYGGSSSISSIKGGVTISHSMPEQALKVMFELREIGVRASTIKIIPQNANRAITIEFSWSHSAGLPQKTRRLHFVTADITNPTTYPEFFRSKLSEGIDIFYMKAAFSAPLKYSQFLPEIAKHVNPQGWLMTTDITFVMHPVDPQPCLEQNGFVFQTRESPETANIKKSLHIHFDPFASPPNLAFFPEKNQRPSRTPGSDLKYWALLNLRQKVS